MQNFSDRFEALLQYLDITSYKMAKDIGTSESVLSNVRAGKNKPSYDLLIKILSIYEVVSADWLMTGDGQMLKNTAATPSQSDGYDSFNDSSSDYTPSPKSGNVSPTKGKYVSPTVSPTVNLGLPKVVTVSSAGIDNVVLVPLRARAGYLLGYGDPEYIEELPSYNLPNLSQGTYRAFEVEGHSMVPTLAQGDIVVGSWVESFNDIKDDRVYIIVTANDGIVVKRVLNRVSQYDLLIAKSDSVTNRTQYPNLNIHPSDVLELWYVRMYLSGDLADPSDIWDRINNLEANVAHLTSALDQGKLKN